MEEIRCNVCGSLVNPGDSFCQNCGSPIEAPKQPEEKAPETSVETTIQETPAYEAPVVNETNAEESVAAPVEEPVISSDNSVPPASESTESETTVLSGNPYNLSQESQNVNTGATGTYYQQIPNQQIPNQQMNTYEEPYQTPYTQSTVPQKSKAGKVVGIIGLILGIIGLLTSACGVPIIFCIAGLILSIVCLCKKGSKGLGISGLVINIIGVIVSLIFLIIYISLGVLGASGFKDASDIILEEYDQLYNDNSNSSSNSYVSSTVLSDTNQIMVQGDIYTFPASLDELGLKINESSEDKVSNIETVGFWAGDYEFVLLDSNSGYSVWGYIENTSDETVYSVDDLKVTGINVDNYSGYCDAASAEVYNGIYLGMSKDDVIAKLGEPTDTGEDGVYYEDDDSYDTLYLEYDEDDNVCCIEVTVYVD